MNCRLFPQYNTLGKIHAPLRVHIFCCPFVSRSVRVGQKIFPVFFQMDKEEFIRLATSGRTSELTESII